MLNNDQTITSSCIMYKDFKNLYGYSLLQPLPQSGFEFVEDSLIITIQLITNYDK